MKIYACTAFVTISNDDMPANINKIIFVQSVKTVYYTIICYPTQIPKSVVVAYNRRTPTPYRGFTPNFTSVVI